MSSKARGYLGGLLLMSAVGGAGTSVACGSSHMLQADLSLSDVLWVNLSCSGMLQADPSAQA